MNKTQEEDLADIGEIDITKLGAYNSSIWSLDNIIKNNVHVIDLLDTACLSGGKHELSLYDEIVCKKCGLVIEQELSMQERRTYTLDDFKKRKNTEKKYSDIGPRTVINRADINKLKISQKQKKLLNTLCTIQGNLVNSLERNFWEAGPAMKKLKEYINNDTVMEEAWMIYKRTAMEKLTAGRSIVGFIGASVYASMKNNNITIAMNEFITALRRLKDDITENQVMNYYQMMLNKKIADRKSSSTLAGYINKYGNMLKLHPMVITESLKYVPYFTTNKGLILNSKTGTGITSAIFYYVLRNNDFSKDITCLENYNWPLTQQEIAKGIGITPVTLRVRESELLYFIRLNEIKEILNLSDKSLTTGVNTLKNYLKKRTNNKKDNIKPVVNTLVYILMEKVEKENTEILNNFLKKNWSDKSELRNCIKEYFPTTYKKYYST